MRATEEQLAEDPAYQAWLRKKLAEQSDAGSVADLSLPASQPGAPDQASAALHSLSLTAADGPQPQQDDDPWYAMGSEFLRLPARASRDGDQPGEVVGTAIHVELLGYSMGGQVAQHFAAAHPERVRSLALLAPAGCHHEHIRPERHRRAAALLQHPLYPLVRDRLFTRRFKSFYSRHTAEVDVIYQETLELAQSRDFLPWLRGMGELIESMLRMPTKPLLGRITAPTLVLFGSEDRVVPPASGRDIERGIPNATLRLLPGCGHLLNVELRDEVNESVLPFLREHERAAVRPAEVSA